jgi:hypothetical protein
MRRILAVICAIAIGAQALKAQAASPETYLAAGSKSARCKALSNWYTRTLEVAGRDAFSPDVAVDVLQKTTARGFVDDVFAPAIGAPYNDLTARQRKSIHGDIGSCDMAPVDNVMRDYMQSAFSDDTRFSMVRGWQTTIPLAQRRAADAGSFRAGATPSAAPPVAAATGSLPYNPAASTAQRCAALQKWYERGIALTGKQTFGSVGIYNHDVMRSFARAFQDDTFPAYFGVKYRELDKAQMPAIRDDVLKCNTPALGQWAGVVGAAFNWGAGRDAWLKPIDAQAAELARMRYDAIPERASSAVATPAPGKGVGPYDASNRSYSRLIHSDDRVNVGARDLVSSKCQMAIEYTVGIDLPRNAPITPAIAKDVIDKVLAPLAARECPGTDLTLFAHFYSRTLSVTNKGEVVPVGSVEITGELELATATYGPGHRQQKAMPSLDYGGMNLGYPELASLDGIVGYKLHGRSTAQVAASTPKVETSYVNYQPAAPRGAMSGRTHGRLIQQMADHDFLGVQLDPTNYPSFDASGTPQDGLVALLSLFTSMGKLDAEGLDLTPPRRGLSYAIEAFSDSCRTSLGPNPASYTPVWQELVGTTVQNNVFNTIVTRHMKTVIGKTIYMETAYRDLYVKGVANEKSILMREIFRLRDELGEDQLLAGQATVRPLLAIKAFQDDTAAFVRASGCETGRKLLRNWVEFRNGPKPAARPGGDYPMVVERKLATPERQGETTVVIGDVPASAAPFYPYKEDTWLRVQYLGDREGALRGYDISQFNLVFLPQRMQTNLMSGEHDELLRTFQTDRIRIVNCFYDAGVANYWLEGGPQPNDRQKALAGTAFRGTAARCPARWPG